MEYWKLMNFKNKIFIILLISFIAAKISFSQNCKASISINTDDDSSLIFLNDNFLGKGNVSIEAPKGTYFIKVTKSIMKWNAKNIYDTIQV